MARAEAARRSTNPVTPDLQKITALAVHLAGRRIGIINRLAGDRHLFSFEQDYIDDARRPTLSLSFKGRHGGLVDTVKPTRLRLPTFFANLLPEGHLRTYLAALAEIKPERDFALLAALGADLPGAVGVTPTDDVDMTGRVRGDDGVDDRRRRQHMLRFSLAGVQLKFSAVNEAKGGLTIPTDGLGGSWIVKLPSTQYPAVPENEFAMLALARSVGITVPSTRLVDIGAIHGLPEEAARLSGKALAVERFDRSPDGRRIHMEDFAQVFGQYPDDKYDRRSYANIASVLAAETSEHGVEEFVRRLVFSVLIGNADMHLKNWSLLYPDGRTPVLSPAYDFVATIAYIPNDQLALGFGESRSLDDITRDQIRRFADTAHLAVRPLARLVSETTERTLDAWNRLPEKSLLPSSTRTLIDRHIKTTAANVRRAFP
jgi:serine/threonine-protein kinase HipA